MGKANIKKHWEHGQVDLTTTDAVYKIADLRGGESITIKALSGNSGNAYIGDGKDVTSSNGFELDSSETLTLTLPITFGADNYIEIWATTSNGTDDLCWVKLIGLYPMTMAVGEYTAPQKP